MPKKTFPHLKRASTQLIHWYQQCARDLPWRHNRNPYFIWVSEVMLQQTQVATVIPYFERFIEAFPTLQSLAKAPTDDVLALWTGLGYYSRAKNLQRGANYILDVHQGSFPNTHDEILKVPGIGPYTAGAILSIAFDQPQAIVDGNVKRVFARYFAIEQCLSTSSVQKLLWTTAQHWVELSHSPHEFNQALMELGATVCTKGAPQCPRCPIHDDCQAYKQNIQTMLPILPKRRKSVELHWLPLLLVKKDKVFLKKNAANTWWAGRWDVPRLETTTTHSTKTISKALSKHGLSDAFEVLKAQKHTVTHHKITARPILLKPDVKNLRLLQPGKWVPIEELDKYPVSSLTHKVIQSYKIWNS